MQKHQNCIYCGKQILNKGSLSSHQKRCQKNPNRVIFKVGLRKYGNNKTGTSWSKGLTKQTDERILKQSLKNKEAIKRLKQEGLFKEHGKAKTEEAELERRRKISQYAKEHHYGGLQHGSGRGKKGWYKGYWCDSSWELAFVIYNLEHNIKFQRNKEGFEYQFNNKKHKFYPDFVMEDGTYIQIKGVMTEQNKIKIQTFSGNHKLKIIDKKEINIYLDYVIGKYSKNFIELYENK